MYKEEKTNIELLKNQEQLILNKNDNSPKMQKYLKDVRAEIKHLEDSLPQKSLTLQNSVRPVSREDAFNSLGEQMTAIAAATMPGQQTDPRLYNAATGLNETIPSDGGFLVQPDFSYDLLKPIFTPDNLAYYCNRFPLQGNSIKLPAIDETARTDGNRWGGTLGYWVAEAGEITKSKPTFRQLQLELKKMACLCYASDEVIADANVLAKTLQQSFVDEMSFMLNAAIINGSGSGMPLGITNSGAMITVDKEAGQTASTIVYENILSMWSRLLPRSKKSAVWLINTDIEPQLYSMSLAVGTGGAPVFMPSGGASDQPYATLFGRPIIPIESCSTLGTAGDIILADLTNGYILADKATGPEFAQSIHVRFIYDEMAYRMTYRVDGQPVLSQPITPAQGSNTQSHFVALQTRS